MKSVLSRRYWVLPVIAMIALVAIACGPTASQAPTVAPTSVPAATTVPATTAATTAATSAATTAATAAATTAATAAATTAPTTAAGGQGGTITIAFYQEPNALIGYYSSQTFTGWVMEMVNIGLWTFDTKAQPFLEAAEAYPTKENGGVSADGLTYTIKLKKDLKWSDGQPLTSKDVKFTWESIMNPKNTGVAGKSGYDQIASIDTPDDQTAVIKFKQFYAPWYTLFRSFSGGLLPQHILGSKDTIDNDPFLRAPVYAGPFKVTEWKGGDHITLEANANYWRGRPKLDKINIKIVPSREAGVAGLQTGDVDMVADLIESYIPDLKALEPKATALATPSQDFEHYFFNLGTKANGAVDGPPYFQDAVVRKAYNMCINRDSIAKNLLFGLTKTIGTLWPNSQWDNTNLKPYAFDPDAANKMLDDAGYAKGDDGIRAKDFGGKRVRLSFNHETTTGNQLRADVQVLVTTSLRSCGFEMLPQNYPSGTLFGTFAQDGPLATGKYDTGGYTTAFAPDPDPADNLECSGIPTKEKPDGSNWYRLCDPDLDKLSKAQKAEPDQTKRKQIFDQMQQLMYDKAYVAPLYNRLHVGGISARVKGVTVSPPQEDFAWNVWEWSVSQ